jgi:hypothetical protein
VISDLNRRQQRGFEQKEAKETKAWFECGRTYLVFADELSVGMREITEGLKRI